MSEARPKGPPSEVVAMRFNLIFLSAVDRWRAKQPHQPSRPQAIVQLAAYGLRTEGVEVIPTEGSDE